MDQLGEPRDHRPRKRFWARFAEQETGPQKVLVGLAGTVTALATSIGGVYAVTQVMRDDPQTVADDSTGAADPSGTPGTETSATLDATPTATPSNDLGIDLRPGQTLVTQGSKEADDLVHAFVDKPGQRTELDIVLVPTSTDKFPPYALILWYNCQGLPEGEPPGADLCDSVAIAFDEAKPPPTFFNRPRRWELTGIWADARPSGLPYGAQGLEIFPAPASF
jgi:hypothetical protein